MSAGNSAGCGSVWAHSPPCKGGVAAASIKSREATEAPQTAGGARASPTRSASAVARSLKKAQPSTEAVAHTQRFQNAFRNVTRERPPRPRLFGTGPFFDGAATPPLQGGEYARLNSSQLLSPGKNVV